MITLIGYAWRFNVDHVLAGRLGLLVHLKIEIKLANKTLSGIHTDLTSTTASSSSATATPIARVSSVLLLCLGFRSVVNQQCLER